MAGSSGGGGTCFADPPEVAGHPLTAAARRLAGELRAGAGAAERDGVSRDRLDRLAAAGLHGLYGPHRLGGAPAAVSRRVAELLAGADGTTWLVWYQHGVAIKVLARSGDAALRDRWLPALGQGRVQATVAFSHLRRPGRTVTATRRAGGWRLTGRAPWCTGFGLADLVLLGAVSDEDPERVVFALVPLAEGAGLRAGPLRLAAMDGSRTVALTLDGYEVADEDVIQVVPRQQWAAADLAGGADVQPSVFGVAEAALAGLAEADPGARRAHEAGLARCRATAYWLADSVPPGERVPRRLAVRADALARTVAVTAAYVTAGGGAAMAAGSPAQRLARHALLHLVFAQSRPARAATLDALADYAAAPTNGTCTPPTSTDLLLAEER